MINYFNCLDIKDNNSLVSKLSEKVQILKLN